MCSALQQTHAHVLGLQTTKVLSSIPLQADQQTIEKVLPNTVLNMPSPQTPSCEDENKPKFIRFPKSRKGKLAVLLDFFIFLLVFLLIALIEFGFVPERKSGFYCKDPKISFKFTGDTIPMGVLLPSVYVLPLILISIVEIRANRYSLNEILRRIWFWYKDFLLGITIVILITEFAKIVIGEPRPHFLSTCRPDTAINCTAGSYIPTYICTNREIREWIVRDSSRSFPSGHTSLSIFTALFCIWYLQKCWLDLSSKLIKPFMQTLVLVASVMCSLSRIADNRHHWWDVLAGAVLGVVCALYTLVVFSKNFQQPFLTKPRPSHSTCTLLTDTTNKNATSVVL